MCKNCYFEAGEPKIINDKVIHAVKLIEAVYDINGVGGNLHVVLDDWNTDLVEGCKELIDAEEDEEKKAIELACYNHLITITEDELITALAIRDGFISPASEHS